MSKFIINGGKSLNGYISAQGSKNSAVAILIASIISDGISEINGVPDITDVHSCLELLKCLGIKTEFSQEKVLIDTGGIKRTELPNEVIKKMRASSYLIGAELSRFGECVLPNSGGCNFGSRPINFHINAMCSLGATENENKLVCSKLHGGNVILPYPSVGATVNTIIAAAKAEGVTIIKNAAREPHIEDLAKYLNSCGANIKGAGSDTIIIIGQNLLHGGKIKVSPDMIETGTYLLYGLMTNGCVNVTDTEPCQLNSLFDVLHSIGAEINIEKNTVSVIGNKLRSAKLATAPYPGFPTDLQPQISALLGMINGVSIVKENVFSDRFGYIRSLTPFGFNYSIKGSILEIKGSKYAPADSLATDLRGGAAAVGAALSANGCSIINNAEPILRGYSFFTDKLKSLGADIILE